MSAAVRWGFVDRNLVREVKCNKETPRDRYVSDTELAAFLEHATPLVSARSSIYNSRPDYVRVRFFACVDPIGIASG
jgi:hypothetical protein